MLITTTGVVIREKPVGEYNKFIELLTPQNGIIEVSVKGSKKISSKSSSSTQLFAYSKFCLQKRGQVYYINSSEPINIFYNLRTDIEKTALASYFADILRYAVTSEEPAQSAVKLLLNTFYFMTKSDKTLSFLKGIFELRLMSDIGMMPNIVSCRDCMKYSDTVMYFCIEDGIILCSDCKNKYTLKENTVEINESLLHTIRYILLSDCERLWNFKISDNNQKKLSYIAENYLISHLGRNFKTLDFYKSLLQVN